MAGGLELRAREVERGPREPAATAGSESACGAGAGRAHLRPVQVGPRRRRHGLPVLARPRTRAVTAAVHVRQALAGHALELGSECEGLPLTAEGGMRPVFGGGCAGSGLRVKGGEKEDTGAQGAAHLHQSDGGVRVRPAGQGAGRAPDGWLTCDRAPSPGLDAVRVAPAVCGITPAWDQAGAVPVLAEAEAAEARDEGTRRPPRCRRGGGGKARGVREDLLLDQGAKQQRAAVEGGLGRACPHLGPLAVAERVRDRLIWGSGPVRKCECIAGSGGGSARRDCGIGDRSLVLLNSVGAFALEADERDGSEAEG